MISTNAAHLVMLRRANRDEIMAWVNAKEVLAYLFHFSKVRVDVLFAE